MIEPMVVRHAVIPGRLQKAALGDLGHAPPEIRQRFGCALAPANGETVRQHYRVHGAGTGRAHPVDLETRLLEQPLENAPAESAVGAAALKREIDKLCVRHQAMRC